MTDLSTQGTGTTAFVLSGGANLGASQVGMLQGLLEAGIKPDLIVGSSVGALNGACLAGSPTLEGVRALAELWAGLRRRDVFPFRGSQFVAGFKGRTNHFFDAQRFASFLGRLSIGFDRLEDSPIPLHVVTTDLATGSPVVLSSGNVIDALMASTALPGVFPPVQISGQRLIDGGVAANTPVAQAQALGAAQIYLLLTSSQISEPIETAPDLMMRAMRMVIDARDAELLSRAAIPVHMLPVPAGEQPSMFDFTQSGTLMARSLAETRQWLATTHAGRTRGPATSNREESRG